MEHLPPDILCQENYDSIERRMLETRPNLPTAFMAEIYNGYTRPQLADFTFTSQALALERENIDLLLFTSASAIPTADAFQRFFVDRKSIQPTMSHIKANFTLVAISAVTAMQDVHTAEQRNKEVSRLARLLKSAKRPCIVEQYVYSGNTMRYASELLRDAGAHSIAAVTGSWYQGANRRDIHQRHLTSKHRVFFSRIGAMAAQI